MDTSQPRAAWLNKYRFVGYFALTQIILVFGFFAFVTIFEKQLPAPRLSSSESFNEKARWLRELGNKKCDVLVIGSSMAINNVDWAFIRPALNNMTVVNTASWDMSIAASATMLKYIAPVCNPRFIVLVAFFGDFNSKGHQPIDWEFFQDYFNGQPSQLAYLKSADLTYYLSTFLNLKNLSNKGNTVYESLNFDETGSVMLNCNNFVRKKSRWDGYNSYLSHFSPGKVQVELDGLAEIEHIARTNHIHLVVVSTPLRKVAEDKIAATWVATLLEKVKQSVQGRGGVFIQAGALANFTDSDFADFAHLNECGARKMATLIAPLILKLSAVPAPMGQGATDRLY
ncbi:MAG: hypothetical protein HOO95_07405 [Gallionella sp.]|nr:hypothetical protein [Gallionella sp.]